MSQPTASIIDLSRIVRVLTVYRWRWLVPTVVIAALALGYACLRNADWEASQALLVRDEASGSLARPGRFDNSDSMKTAQQTVLELARSHAVIRAALVEVGPVQGRTSADWPGDMDIEKTQDKIRIDAPNGAEFGSTEVFYISVRNHDLRRAVALTDALCRQLDLRLQLLRDQRSGSLVEELDKTVGLAQADLDEATGRLAALEQEVGGDLAELRILNESAAGESNLRRTLINIKNELRQARDDHRAKQHLRDTLVAAQNDENQLVAMPNELLISQPALRQLKDGLVAAQLATATLRGDMSELHPKVQAARASQEQIRRNLFGELETAVRSIQIELRMSDTRVQSLQEQLDEVQGRIIRVAGLRAGYGNLVNEVRHRGETLRTVQHDLAEANANHAAARSVSLITRLDGPVGGARPLGPRKALIVMIGVFGGLATGSGVVYLSVPQSELTSAPKRIAAAAPPVKKSLELPGHNLSFKQALLRLTQPVVVWN